MLKTIKLLIFFALIAVSPRSGFAKVTWRTLWDGTVDASKGSGKFPGFLIKGTVNNWILKDSAIYIKQAEGRVESVWYKQVFTEGTFEISYKILAGNGGVYILGRPAGTEETDVDNLGTDLTKGTNSIAGLEIDVNPEGNDGGCLFCNDCGNFLSHVTNEAASKTLTDFKGWIDLRAVVKGRRFRTYLKQHGVDTWTLGIDYTLGDVVTGRFGVEVYTGEMSYKGFKLAQGCSDKNSKYYDKAAVADSGWALEDNGSCDPVNWGCKDTSFTEYNSKAPYSDSSLCLTNKSLSIKSFASNAFSLDRSSGLIVRVSTSGEFKIGIYDLTGNLVFQKSGVGPGEHQIQLKPGMVVVKVTAGNKAVYENRILLLSQ